MNQYRFVFDRKEFAGSLGDLGTLIPLSVALMVISGLSVTAILLMIGIFYIGAGMYFRLPIPVQPLKVVSAIAIAFPEKITPQTISAAAIMFGIILLLIGITGVMDYFAKLFTKPIIRGIQLGLGFILMLKGVDFITKQELFLNGSDTTYFVAGVPVNLLVGVAAFLTVLVLLNNQHFPAALVVVGGGILIGILMGALNQMAFSLGATPIHVYSPSVSDFSDGFWFLVLPQIPLTIGNAVIGTADACKTFFGDGEQTKKANYKAFAGSMGIINIVAGLFMAMPMCHGAGGLAAHYRFGARTGGSNIMIGILFIVLGLLFGKIGISLLTSIPHAVLGVLLLFAGLELALLVRDLTEKSDWFITLLIGGIGLATTNMGIAFFVGIIIAYLIRIRNIRL